MTFTERLKRLQSHVGAYPDGIFGNETLTKLEREVFGYEEPDEESASFIDRLVSIAHAETGTREEGNNGGERVRLYQSATWLDPAPWPWCAAFICWIVLEAMSDDETFTRPQTASAWGFEKWARGEYGPVPGVRLIKPTPEKIEAGDIVVFKFSHIGIAVEDSNGSTVRTVEGNTNSAGSREGDGVWMKTRKPNQIRSVIRFV